MEAETAFDDWTPVLPDADLPLEKAVRTSVADREIFLFRTGDRLFAMDDRCTHMQGPLHRGVVRATGSHPTVTCPVHGSMFWMTDGRVVRGPASRAQPVYEVRVNDGAIEVRAPR